MPLLTFATQLRTRTHIVCPHVNTRMICTCYVDFIHITQLPIPHVPCTNKHLHNFTSHHLFMFLPFTSSRYICFICFMFICWSSRALCSCIKKNIISIFVSLSFVKTCLVFHEWGYPLIAGWLSWKIPIPKIWMTKKKSRGETPHFTSEGFSPMSGKSLGGWAIYQYLYICILCNIYI